VNLKTDFELTESESNRDEWMWNGQSHLLQPPNDALLPALREHQSRGHLELKRGRRDQTSQLRQIATKTESGLFISWSLFT